MERLKGKAAENEDGFAALVVGIVIILVLSLITIGFAQLMQADQKQALDKQLSSQAYYAAEAGINDAAEAYAAGYSLPKTTCPPLTGVTPTNPGYYLSQGTINNTNNVSISCLLTDPTPSSIRIPASDNQPTVVELQGCSQTSGGANPINQCGGSTASTIGTITISYNDTTGNAPPVPSFQTCTNHLYPRSAVVPSDTVWSYQNILRLELVPVVNGSISRSQLVNDEYTAFLCPDGRVSGNYPITTNTGLSSGDLLDSSCAASSSGGDVCTTTLDVSNMNGNSSGYTTYFLIIRGIYQTDITANITLKDNSSPPQTLNIGDAQLAVDSTGKANGVLKRIQVRVPETNVYYMPEADVHGEICKQLGLAPTTAAGNTSVDYSPCGNNPSSLRGQL